ncbi:thiol-disulfide oxidoreductase DCC family protein [Natronorubrum thiooxidans]|uniref:Predicted thiol-disulfide oxidoreductase YuxK, DCC family n=1 Tax=Natronorubrum thiooxidans TaxID=308853 RepID=A0A1N7DN19_9EURY|nr:thiol-disulfide oxidoreductase DCC family protein [Natronorubrum thiooxidans]SIR77226.1 Predicted thiol-disulfide oxidoreductase YuxK, DCC family [Natronorubrum thiooxidans]
MSVDVPDDGPIVLFDGVCNLCHGFVQFILPRDTEKQFYFASLQSDVAQELLAAHGLETESLESVVLIEGEDAYVKSAAVIRIAQRLGGVYRLLGPFRFLPRRLRDWLYDLVADHRYRVFGTKDQCMLPTGDVRDRFLE